MNPRPTIIVRRRADVDKAVLSRAPDRDLSRDPIPRPIGDLSRGTPHTILVVDDSPVHLKLLARQLGAGLGCRILTADGAETAIVHLLATRPDLIVTDLMMPAIDGMDLMAALDTRDDWRQIPIVVNSAVADQERVKSMNGARVREYLVKPFNADIAIPRVRRIFDTLRLAGPASPARATVPFSDGIPIVFACGRHECATMLKAITSPYDVSVVPSGPAALVATIALQPWTVFVTPDVGPWDLAKTVRTLLALKTFGRVRTIPLSWTDDGQSALATVRGELARGPFEIDVSAAAMTVRISETFTLGCIRALQRDIAGFARARVGQIIVDIPYQDIQRSAFLGLQNLIQGLRDEG